MKRWLKAISEETGYLLVDVLVAMLIFTIAGLTTMTFYSVALSSTSLLRQETEASYLARQQIESLQQYDQNNYTLDNTAFWNTIIPSSNTQTMNGHNYTISLRFIPSNELPVYTSTSGDHALTSVSSNNNIMPIRVVVSWVNRGSNRSIILDAYLMR